MVSVTDKSDMKNNEGDFTFMYLGYNGIGGTHDYWKYESREKS